MEEDGVWEPNTLHHGVYRDTSRFEKLWEVVGILAERDLRDMSHEWACGMLNLWSKSGQQFLAETSCLSDPILNHGCGVEDMWKWASAPLTDLAREKAVAGLWDPAAVLQAHARESVVRHKVTRGAAFVRELA